MTNIHDPGPLLIHADYAEDMGHLSIANAIRKHVARGTPEHADARSREDAHPPGYARDAEGVHIFTGSHRLTLPDPIHNLSEDVRTGKSTWHAAADRLEGLGEPHTARAIRWALEHHAEPVVSPKVHEFAHTGINSEGIHLRGGGGTVTLRAPYDIRGLFRDATHAIRSRDHARTREALARLSGHYRHIMREPHSADKIDNKLRFYGDGPKETEQGDTDVHRIVSNYPYSIKLSREEPAVRGTWAHSLKESTYSFRVKRNPYVIRVVHPESKNGIHLFKFEDGDGSMDVTGKGGAHEVLSHVGHALIHFVKHHATHPVGFDAEGESRVRVYKRLLGILPKYLPDHHVKTLQDNGGDKASWEIHKNTPVKLNRVSEPSDNPRVDHLRHFVRGYLAGVVARSGVHYTQMRLPIHPESAKVLIGHAIQSFKARPPSGDVEDHWSEGRMRGAESDHTGVTRHPDGYLRINSAGRYFGVGGIGPKRF